MASKSAQDQVASSEDIEELLDGVDKNLERVKTLYEQYFLGIQKQAPTFLHTDIERKLRDLTQLNVRNTGLRYRLATLQQKFGAYNSYWKRTLRQIENGTYFRNLSKIGREAIRTGAEIPEEILAAMPKRMREQVIRDRDAAISIAKRRRQDDTVETEPTFAPPQTAELPTVRGAHVLKEDDDFDMSAFFASIEQEDTPTPQPAAPPPAPAPAPLVPPPPPAIAASTMGAIPRPLPPSSRQTGPIPLPPSLRQTGPVPIPQIPQTTKIPIPGQTQSIPIDPTQTQAIPVQVTTSIPLPDQTQPLAVEAQRTGAIPVSRQTGPIPIPTITPRPAPSQAARPNPIQPGAAAARGDVPVESMKGPFARPQPKPAPAPPMKPPPGMSEADVNTLYQKYVQAKQLVGEAPGPREREKLLKTINAQAPKIMEQYKAKGVDFSVVVKDNQVIIRAKPKT